jgi:hypothetical protein
VAANHAAVDQHRLHDTESNNYRHLGQAVSALIIYRGTHSGPNYERHKALRVSREFAKCGRPEAPGFFAAG